MLIFLSGLQSISPAIYEACSIDGASGWETFWKITFPMISPMILVNGVYTIIDSFTTDSNPVMSYISDVYQQSNVLSTAMAWVYFLIVILIIAAFAGIISTYVFYQRRD
jgi:ABC-type sugar transport system permease subunit